MTGKQTDMIWAPDTKAAASKRGKWMHHSQAIAAIMSGKLEELGETQKHWASEYCELK